MSNKQIPTAKEFLLKGEDNPTNTVWTDSAISAMVEFAKFHLEEQAEKIANEAKKYYEPMEGISPKQVIQASENYIKNNLL